MFLERRMIKRNKYNNLIRAKRSELEEEGYLVRVFVPANKKSKESPRSQPGDLLCLVDKKQDLWAELDEYSSKLINPNKHLVLYK